MLVYNLKPGPRGNLQQNRDTKQRQNLIVPAVNCNLQPSFKTIHVHNVLLQLSVRKGMLYTLNLQLHMRAPTLLPSLVHKSPLYKRSMHLMLIVFNQFNQSQASQIYAAQ